MHKEVAAFKFLSVRLSVASHVTESDSAQDLTVSRSADGRPVGSSQQAGLVPSLTEIHEASPIRPYVVLKNPVSHDPADEAGPRMLQVHGRHAA